MECEIAVNFSECRNERGNLFFLTNGGRSHLADATVGPRVKSQAISLGTSSKVVLSPSTQACALASPLAVSISEFLQCTDCLIRFVSYFR